MDNFKDMLGKLMPKESVDIFLGTTDDIFNVSKEKFQSISKQFIGELNGLKPIIKQCGFIIKDINLTFPLPSELKMSIEQTGRGRKSLEDILKEDNEKIDGKMTNSQRTILNLMIKANELATVTNDYGYIFKKYDVTLSATPKITLHLISNKPNG